MKQKKKKKKEGRTYITGIIISMNYKYLLKLSLDQINK